MAHNHLTTHRLQIFCEHAAVAVMGFIFTAKKADSGVRLKKRVNQSLHLSLYQQIAVGTRIFFPGALASLPDAQQILCWGQLNVMRIGDLVNFEDIFEIRPLRKTRQLRRIVQARVEDVRNVRSAKAADEVAQRFASESDGRYRYRL
jgi:hypothetical protein